MPRQPVLVLHELLGYTARIGSEPRVLRHLRPVSHRGGGKAHHPGNPLRTDALGHGPAKVQAYVAPAQGLGERLGRIGDKGMFLVHNPANHRILLRQQMTAAQRCLKQ